MDERAARRAHSGRARAFARNAAVLAVLAGGLTAFAASGPTPFEALQASASSAPSSPPITVCGNASLLSGPATAPAGAVTVPAGDNAALFDSTLESGQTYWFAPGTHTLGWDEFDQIDAADDDTLVGAPGAILDGQDMNDFAIAGSGT